MDLAWLTELLKRDGGDPAVDARVQEAYKKAATEMPDAPRVSVSPRQSSVFARMMMPRGAQAITNPFTGNITYNPEMMKDLSPSDLQQTLIHELTHVQQMKNVPWYSVLAQSVAPSEEYYRRPQEMEAFQAERDRAVRNKLPNYVDPVLGTRDIMLRRSGK